MSTRIRRILAVLAATLMFQAAFVQTAAAQTVAQGDAANASPVVDVLLLRPAGFMSLVVGSGLFLVTAPIVLVTRPHEIGKPFKQLVVRPAKYVWVDPLGGH
ncbi:MAG: hypothetical protein AAGC67_06470 [Myxococcota bacterium]